MWDEGNLTEATVDFLQDKTTSQLEYFHKKASKEDAATTTTTTTAVAHKDASFGDVLAKSSNEAGHRLNWTHSINSYGRFAINGHLRSTVTALFNLLVK